jgi:hypothetical protein
VLITQLRLIMTTPTQMTPAKMTPEKADAGCNHALRVSLLDLKGPCIVCHEFEVHNGLAYLTGDLRCVPCQRAQLFRTVWPLNREFAEGWRQMFELAEVAHDYQAKQDETAGVPPDLDFCSKHILREMHQGAHNTHSTAVMTEASAQDSERQQMLACLADVISRFDANADAKGSTNAETKTGAAQSSPEGPRCPNVECSGHAIERISRFGYKCSTCERVLQCVECGSRVTDAGMRLCDLCSVLKESDFGN